MSFRTLKICGCGRKVQGDRQCVCQARRKLAYDAHRPTARQRGYDSKWDRERAAFLKMNATCRRCGEPATLVDHVIPHRRNWKLFWNRSNWAPLCTSCHSRWKQREENVPCYAA
jgi:5-methylcytosine-specific restriction protein A